MKAISQIPDLTVLSNLSNPSSMSNPLLSPRSVRLRSDSDITRQDKSDKVHLPSCKHGFFLGCNKPYVAEDCTVWSVGAS
jgi:hypothetical protein